MNSRRFGMFALALSGAISAQAAGFALYEGSAAGTALGGAVMGKAVDASALFYNPATMTDFESTTVSLGFVTEHPTADVSVDSRSSTKMDPGFFVLPHFHLIQPLTDDLYFGFGFAPEYGLGSHYNKNWSMAWDTQKTTIKGLVVNPNLAYQITDDWSIAAGARVMHISFEQCSNPNGMELPPPHPPMTVPAHLRNKIYDAYDWSAGWELSSKYDITKKLHAGILYKSYIDAKLKGKQKVTGSFYHPQYQTFVPFPGVSGPGGAKVRTPQSITIGLNYDLTDTIEVGTALTWTQWSGLKALNFHLPSGSKRVDLKWKDAYRIGVGGAWKFYEGWKAMGSYVYDMDPCRHNGKYGTTMLPPGDRHIISTGLAYQFLDHWEIAGTAGYIVMCENSLYRTDALGNRHKFDTHRGRSMAFGLTLTYFF